ncbi:MAG TPA: hypothetical protein VGP72_14675 [Planctomycetota bacterium]
MAYTAEQQRDIARELARSGGNVMAALKRLREEYESFRQIGESTLRRCLKEDGFAAMVAEEGERMLAARAEGIATAERERARREAEGTMVARLQHDEAILDALRKRVEEETAKPDFDTDAAVRLYATMTKIHDRRKSELIPAVAETREATALVESVLEAAVQMLGQGKAGQLITEIKTRYAAKLQAFAQEAQQQEAPQANG